MKWKVSHLEVSPRGSRSLFCSLGLACAFAGVEKYISYKEFNRPRGARRNLKGGLGGERGGGRREGKGGGGERQALASEAAAKKKAKRERSWRSA